MEENLIVLGCTRDNKKAFISKEVCNRNLMAVGKSGCGKTTEVMKLIIQKAKAGEHVIILNYQDCTRGLPATLLREYISLAEIIDVSKDGLPIPLFTPQYNEGGDKEGVETMLDRIVKLFKYATNLAPTQEKILKDAVWAVHEEGADDGMASVADFLRVQNKLVANQTLVKLGLFCKPHFFSGGDFLQFEKNIVEIDLTRMEYDDRMPVVRFLLDFLLRMSLKGKFREKGITILLDEAQNLDFSEDAPIFKLVNESRKQNVCLAFTTPSIMESRKRGMDILTQCGTCLYFSPSDCDRRKIATFIADDPKNTDYWVYVLSKLGRGEFVAKGGVAVGETVVSKPTVLKSIFTDNSVIFCGAKAKKVDGKTCSGNHEKIVLGK